MMNLFSNRVHGLVSVVMATYNREKYIIEALDSIKYQTYKNIEVVIVDDGSTDQTESVVDNWHQENADLFYNFIYVKLPRNREEEWAFNIAICLSSGEYIAIQHSDDISHKERIQKQVEFLLKNPETACVGTRCYIFDTMIDKIIGLDTWVCCDRNKIDSNYKDNIHCICNGASMFRAYMFEEMVGYRKNKGAAAGEWFFYKLVYTHGYVIDNIPDALYYYRKHDGQTTQMYSSYSERVIKKINGRVSVVIPLYRKSSNVLEAVKSIFEQTYKDIEIVIADELLDEKIEGEIKDFCCSCMDSRKECPVKELVYFKLPRKVGYPWICNIGTYLSLGEYIVLHGDNGISRREKLEKQVAFMSENDIYTAVGTNYEPDNDFIRFDGEIEQSYMIGYVPSINMDTIMLRSYIIDTTGGLNQSMPGSEGFEFIHRIIEDNYLVQNLKEVLYIT